MKSHQAERMMSSTTNTSTNTNTEEEPTSTKHSSAKDKDKKKEKEDYKDDDHDEKKRQKMQELFSQAKAKAKFSSDKEDPIVMSPEIFFSNGYQCYSSTNDVQQQQQRLESSNSKKQQKSTATYCFTHSTSANINNFLALAQPLLSSTSSSWNTSWTNLLGFIAWDVLQQTLLNKANHPWQVPLLLQRILLLAYTSAAKMAGNRIGHPSSWTNAQPLLPAPSLSPPLLQPRQQQQRPSSFTPTVRGMPNFGQTCFLNVVVHGMASLDSMLVYVDWIAQEQETWRLYHQQQDEAEEQQQWQSQQNRQSTIPTTISEVLLPLLDMANGNPGTIDPRELLWQIGDKNSQFRTRGWGGGRRGRFYSSAATTTTGEQQDAQECLQALLGMMVTDARLEKGMEKACSYQHQQRRRRPLEPPRSLVVEEKKDDCYYDNDSGYDSDSDEVLTVLSDRWSPNKNMNMDTISCSNSEEADGHGHGHVTDMGADSSGSGSASGSGMWVADTSHGETILDGMNMVDSTGKVSSFAKKKKPTTAPVQDISASIMSNGEQQPSMASSFLSTTSTVVTSSLSTSSMQWQLAGSKDEDQTLVSASMKMLSTISSITPSPLCGWEGSVLQCQTCQHVRPIENSPFFMIPIVPTSMAMGPYVSNKNNDSSSNGPPPCSVEQCLHYYTQMERVTDVECGNCTLQMQLRDLQEEVDLLQGAVESIERRRKQQHRQQPPPNGKPNNNYNTGGNEQQDTTLRQELAEAQEKLRRLQRMDPDDYDLDNGDDDPTAPSKLLRSEALKCMILTRCPSVLCLHVQRRYFDPMTDQMSKNLQHVRFDEFLDLSPFCAYGRGGVAGSGDSGNGRSSHTQQQHQHQHHSCTTSSTFTSTTSSMRYRLTCVIEHKGNAHGGHYVCYRRLPSQFQTDYNKWYYCSDETILTTTWQTVRQCQAYMLLYEAV